MNDIVTCACGFESHPSCRFCIQCGETLAGSAPAESRPVKATAVEPPPAKTRPDASTEDLVRTFVKGCGFPAHETRAGWSIQVKQGDREQEVHVVHDGKDHDGHDVVTFLSVCTRAKPRFAEELLRLNSKLLYCAYGIRKFKRGAYFVTAGSQLASTADEAELTKSLLSVARNADRLEGLLSPRNAPTRRKPREMLSD